MAELTKAQEAAKELRYMVASYYNDDVRYYGYPKSKENEYKKLLEEADLSYGPYDGPTPIMVASLSSPRVFQDVLSHAKLKDLLVQGLEDHRKYASVMDYIIRWPYDHKDSSERQAERFKVLVDSKVFQENQEKLLTPEIWEMIRGFDPELCSVFKGCTGWKDEYLIYSHLRRLSFNADIPELRKAEDFMLHSPLTQDEKMRQLAEEIIASVEMLDLGRGCLKSYVDLHGGESLDINSKDMEYLATKLCPNVETLQLPFYAPRINVSNNVSDELMEAVSHFKKLKCLRMQGGPGITQKTFDILGKMDSLEELHFDKMSLTLDNIKALAKLPHLKEIYAEKWPDREKVEGVFSYLIPYGDMTWIGPKHKDYKRQKAIFDEKRQRVQQLTGTSWKDIFHEALKKNDKWTAMEILELNGFLNTLRKESTTQSNWGTEKDFLDPKMGIAPWANYKAKDSVAGFDILDLGNKRIAFGYAYDDDSWKRKTGERAWGGGIAYSRSVEVGIIDLDKGLIAESGRSGSIAWRDRYDSSRDIAITNMDHFLEKNGNTVVAQLKSYNRPLISISVEIPKTKTTLKKTLTKGKTADAVKVKANRDQKQGE